MRINIENTSKVQVALDEVQARCSARTVSAHHVQVLGSQAEYILRGIPERLRVGAELTYCAEITCAAYKKKAFSAQSTMVVLRRGTRHWFLVDAARATIYPKAGARDISVRLNPASEAEAGACLLKARLAGETGSSQSTEVWAARRQAAALAGILQVPESSLPEVLEGLVSLGTNWNPLPLLTSASDAVRRLGLRLMGMLSAGQAEEPAGGTPGGVSGVAAR